MGFFRGRVMGACCAASLFGMQLAIGETLPNAEVAESAPPACVSEEIILYEAEKAEKSVVRPNPCVTPTTPLAAARAYLIETARPGDTMTRQGPELAIGRLHPEFVTRLADSIHEARAAGLASAGIFSAYRPPIFGVGGFSDKFNSLHSYGLAVDMYGIGMPGTPEAKLWHEIAAKHGVVCPYGYNNRAEWNHCQPTRLKIVRSQNPLRDTITAAGPLSLEGMFEVGETYIASLEEAARPVVDASLPAEALHVASSLKGDRLYLSSQGDKLRLNTHRGKLQLNTPRALSMSRNPSKTSSARGRAPIQTRLMAFRTPNHLRLSGQTIGSWAGGAGPKIITVEEGRRILRDQSAHARTRLAGMVDKK
jgi:hypothetical protein